MKTFALLFCLAAAIVSLAPAAQPGANNAELIRWYESTTQPERAKLGPSALTLVVMAYDRAGRETDAIAALNLLENAPRQSPERLASLLRSIHPQSGMVAHRVDELLAKSTR